MQLDFRGEDSRPVKTATVKAGGGETETLPLYSNKQSVIGEVPRCLSTFEQSVEHACYCSCRRHCIRRCCTSWLCRKVPMELHAHADASAPAQHAQVKVANIPGKKVEHQGVKVQLIGQIELATERGHPHDFVSLGVALLVVFSLPHLPPRCSPCVLQARCCYRHWAGSGIAQYLKPRQAYLLFDSPGRQICYLFSQHDRLVSCIAVRDLAPPGELTSPQTYPFEFANVEMQYDSYRGLQVRLRCASVQAYRALPSSCGTTAAAGPWLFLVLMHCDLASAPAADAQFAFAARKAEQGHTAAVRCSV